MRIASLVLASLVVGVTAEAAYAQSPSAISGYHGAVLFTSHMVVAADAKKIITYTDPESGSGTSAYVFSGHVVFSPRNSTALWSTKLVVINTKNNKFYAKSIRISTATPTAALGNAATPSSEAANGIRSDAALQAAAAATAPNCAVVACTFTASNGTLLANGIPVPGNTATNVAGLEGATVTADGNLVKTTTADGTVIMSESIDTPGAGDSGGGDSGGCDDAVRAAANLLHVQPQEIHVQPEVQSKGVQPEDTDPGCEF